MTQDEQYMQRCLDLAILGSGKVSPNPMVGAVLVHENRIIGEGWHERYGAAHAEVNAVANVKEKDRPFLPQSCLYVSLEPCCIHGNTPPCTDLIIKHRIPKVVISCVDFTPEVHGKGVEILRKAGVEVITHILAAKGEQLSAPRRIFVQKNRPYIILKYAQTKEGFLAAKTKEQIWISNHYSKRLVHKWRSEVDAILVGTTTAKTDNPSLTNRYYYGKSPLRIVLDRQLKLSTDLALFDQRSPTLVYNELHSKTSGLLTYQKIDFSNLLPSLLNDLFSRKLSQLLVEGGAHLLGQFVEAGLWDEARVLVGSAYFPEGIPAPILPKKHEVEFQIGNDLLKIYRNS
ncbi:MAG: riboflavin biosynthesis protein RibD [Saprospiraceae bacterium]|nr:MAG: riboflavin biosynthesis protein RibD [Saprospiraceae bacterium]